MREAVRTEHISRLIEGIKLIGPGALFERFGAKFIDHHLEINFNHRGLNVQLNPIGRTIDSYDDARCIGVEYSAQKDYFTGYWDKPTNDLLHAVRTHTDLKDIYLLSSQVAPVGGIPTFVCRVSDWPGFQHRIVHIYDARRIAEVIVDDLLLNDRALDDLVEHLPALERIVGEVAANLALPKVDPKRVPLKAVEEEIERRITDRNPVLVISGIAGIGKSDAAAAYANSKRSNYQTLMWVEGGDLARVEDLRATRLWRGGADLNVAAMLSSRRCLLIIDDCLPTIQLPYLAELCGPGSHIIVTRRETSPGDLEIPGLRVDEARAILDRDLQEPCPEVVLNILLTTVGGHPLSLALVNKAVALGTSWADIALDCDDVPEMTAGHERLADRVLGRLRSLMGRELTVFEWADQASCDYRFLKTMIKSVGMTKVSGQGLLAPERPSTVRLHDIVFASLLTQRWLTSERRKELNDHFEMHIAEVIAEDGLGLRILATTMRPKLEALVSSSESRAAFLVALLEIWSAEELDVAAVGDPVQRTEELKAAIRPPDYADVRVVLESIESLYRHLKLTNIDEAKDQLRARLPIFDTLLGISGLADRSRAEVRHHRAKALNILGARAEALQEFETVMAGPYPLNATRLQLVRIYARDPVRANDAALLADEIFTAAQVPGSVSSSVVLGVVEALPWTTGEWRKTLFDKHADLIAREIESAADAGSDQAYGALASVGRHWTWHAPARMGAIAGVIPIPSADTANARAYCSLGEILSQAAKSKGSVDPVMQHHALKYFEAIAEPEDYALQKHGQLLGEMGRFPEAEAILRRIQDIKTKPFAAYRLSQALFGRAEAGEALEFINYALEALRPKDARYESAFLAHRFDVRMALKEAEATDDLRKAIAKCQDQKYRCVLEARLAELL